MIFFQTERPGRDFSDIECPRCAKNRAGCLNISPQTLSISLAFFFFKALPCAMWDLSSRDGT